MKCRETLKQFIRPFCKLDSDTCTHIFHSGTPNYAKQGVPDACFKIPREDPGVCGGQSPFKMWSGLQRKEFAPGEANSLCDPD